MNRITDEQARAFYEARRESRWLPLACFLGFVAGLLYSMCFPWGWALLKHFGAGGV